MSFQELVNRLTAQARQGRLTLDEATLGPAGLGDLLTSAIGAKRFEISKPVLTTKVRTVRITGTTSLLGVRDAAVTATVEDATGGPWLTARIALPRGWRFSQSFPDLPQYIDHASRSFGYRDSFLNDLEFTDPAFVLSSRDVTDGDAPVARGLNFVSRVRLTGVLGRIGELAKGDVVSVTGLVRGPGLTDGFCLRAPVPLSLDFGSIGIDDVRLELASTSAGAAVRLTAALEVAGAALRLATQVEIGGANATWVLSGDFDGVALPGLAAIADLVGGSDLARDLPEALRKPAGIELRQLGIGFSPSRKSLEYVRVTVRTTGGWTVVPDMVEVKEVGLRWLIMAPFDARRRAISCTVSGTLDLAGVGVAVAMEVPGMRVIGGLERGQTLQLTELATRFLPDVPDIPKLTVADCVIGVDVRQRAVSLEAALGAWSVPLGDAELEIGRLALAVAYAGGATRSLDATMSGTASIAGATMGVTVRLGGAATITGTLGQVSLAALTSAIGGGATLPDEVPDLRLTETTVSVTPGTGAFAVSGHATASWTLPFGAGGLTVDALDFAVRRGPTPPGGRAAPLSLSLSLRGQGPFTIVDGLTFERFAFEYALTPAGEWSLGGTVSARVLDGECTLAASLTQRGGRRTIALAATRDRQAPPFDLAGVASLDFTKVTIEISKPSQPGAPGGGVSLSPASPYSWDVAVTGGLRLQALPDDSFEGTLALESRADGFGLRFQPTRAQVTVAWPVPETSLATTFTLGPLSVSRRTAADGRSAWTLDASATVAFSGLPRTVQDVLPARITGGFAVGAGEARLTVDRVLAPVEVRIPDARAGEIEIPMGIALLDISNLTLALGQGFRLAADFGIGLPDGLNHILGTRRDGRPNVEPFITYRGGGPAGVTKFRLAVSATEGLSISVVTSPLRAMVFQVRGGHSWATIDLGDYGAFELQVPEFGYTGSAFRASGGFKSVRPVRLPLAPLRLLLSGVGLHDLAGLIPATAPLSDLHVYDPRTGLDVQGLIDALNLPTAFADLLHTVKEHVDRLPSALLSYLNVSVPDGFTFDFAVTPTGGFRGRLAVQGGTPIRLLQAGVGPLGPQFVGLAVHGVTIGAVLGGALVDLELDLAVEQFDLATLAAVLLLPLDRLPMLPDTRRLNSRVTVHNLTVLIIYQAGLPIPIPLFYDELAYDRLGLDGTELRTHWRFPKPKLDAGAISRLFSQFQRFFTVADARLDPDTPPGGLDLAFTIGPNALQLPAYLGGALLGSTQDLATVRVYGGLARTLNFLKTGDIDEIVQAVPIEARTGTVQVAFAPLEAEATWLITTPAEFRRAYESLGVAEGDVDTVLQVVPVSPGPGTHGLVTFLKGSWRFAESAELDVCFGMAATTSGFAIGLRVAGDVTDVVTVELNGAITVDPKTEAVFSLTGRSRLALAGRDVLAGTLSIAGDRFAIAGQLDLFPHVPLLGVTGWLTGWIGGGDLHIAGSVTATLGTGFVLAGATADITRTSVRLSGTWLNQTATFTAERDDQGLTFRAMLAPVNVAGALTITGAAGRAGPTAALTTGAIPKVLLAGSLRLLGFRAEASLAFAADGFSVTVEGKVFDVFQASVSVTGTDLLNAATVTVTATMRSDLLGYLQQQALQTLKAAADGATRSIGQAQAAVDQAQGQVSSLDRQLAGMRGIVQAERDRDQQRLVAAQTVLTSAQGQVSGLDQQITQMRATVQAERRTAQEKLAGAEIAVTNAQNQVNSLNGQIKSTHDWYYNLPATDWPWKDSQATQAIPFAAKMAGLNTALGVATGVLLAAQRTLEAIRAAVPMAPVDADPRVAGLISGRASATAGVAVAQANVRAIQAGLKLFPVDADPRVAGLIAAQATAAGTLVVAQQTLATTKAAVGVAGEVADYVARAGLADALHVTAAGFQGSLNLVSGGSVALWADLTFIGRPQRMRWTFDFHDPLAGARALAQALLGT